MLLLNKFAEIKFFQFMANINILEIIILKKKSVQLTKDLVLEEIFWLSLKKYLLISINEISLIDKKIINLKKRLNYE